MTRTSRFLSLVLRHKPESIGLRLDRQGWVEVSELLLAVERAGHALTLTELVQIVETNDKQRFAFNADRTRIRAVQGHSTTVELGYAPVNPPPSLYHGTVERFILAILAEGLRRGRRHHVHLSADRSTATKVGARRGKPVVLKIDSAAMGGDGYLFYRADNGVWLTDHVPPAYIARDTGARD